MPEVWPLDFKPRSNPIRKRKYTPVITVVVSGKATTKRNTVKRWVFECPHCHLPSGSWFLSRGLAKNAFWAHMKTVHPRL